MSEEDYKCLWFSALPDDEDTILLRIYVPGPLDPKPEILKDLLAMFSSGGNDLTTLASEFPQDKLILGLLSDILSKRNIVRGSITGIHWSSMRGHSIHVQISK